MRCRDVEALCSAYVDGELDEPRASALRGHLRTCEACAAMVEDTVALVRAADALEPVEPSAALWSQIARGLADAEVADADRSRAWLWWQRVRPQLLPATVVAAAAVAVALWVVRPGSAPHDAPQVADTLSEVRTGDTGGEPGGDRVAVTPAGESFADRRARETTEADRRYGAAIAELAALVDEARGDWPAAKQAAFDARIAEFEAAAAQAAGEGHRTAVAGSGNIRDPDGADARLARLGRASDRLYAVYQAQILFMQSELIDRPMLASVTPGAPAPGAVR